jgi:hypothetical protein
MFIAISPKRSCAEFKAKSQSPASRAETSNLENHSWLEQIFVVGDSGQTSALFCFQDGGQYYRLVMFLILCPKEQG